MSTTAGRAPATAAGVCGALALLCAPLAAADSSDQRLAKVGGEWARRQAKWDSVRYVVAGQIT